MRTNPEKKIESKFALDPVKELSRKAAIILAFISVFAFFIKILFL